MVYFFLGSIWGQQSMKALYFLGCSLINLVPGTGLEPVRSFPRGILSPLRLPIPPSRRMEVPPRFELGNKGFADLGLTTWRWHHLKKMERKTRFELATFALARQRSTTEPLPHSIFNFVCLNY